MQNKSVSSDLEKSRPLKRKFNSTCRSEVKNEEHLILNKKMRILFDLEENLAKNQSGNETTNNHQETDNNEKSSEPIKSADSIDDTNVSNHEDPKIQHINDIQEKSLDLKNHKSNSKKLAITNTTDYSQTNANTQDSNYLKYYLNHLNLNQLSNSIKETELNSLNLDAKERSVNEQLRIDNQLNYVQLLNYHHLMQKQFEMNENPNQVAKNQQLNQIKTKLNNYSFNDQQIANLDNQLNSQLINSPDFKQLIEKNRALRLNLAYQKLQAENQNLINCLPMRSVRPCRRQRTTFTNEQTIKLEIEYRQNEYISRNKRFQLADLLDLSENQIKIWFQNRRAKSKRLESTILKQIWN